MKAQAEEVTPETPVAEDFSGGGRLPAGVSSSFDEWAIGVRLVDLL
jgi:hypothetical protein